MAFFRRYTKANQGAVDLILFLYIFFYSLRGVCVCDKNVIIIVWKWTEVEKYWRKRIKQSSCRNYQKKIEFILFFFFGVGCLIVMSLFTRVGYLKCRQTNNSNKETNFQKKKKTFTIICCCNKISTNGK